MPFIWSDYFLKMGALLLSDHQKYPLISWMFSVFQYIFTPFH